MAATKTVKYDAKSGKEVELVSLDAFVAWCNELQQKFMAIDDYRGFPMLPDSWLVGFDLYNKASEDEKRMMFIHVTGLFVESLRHWKTDKDSLYGEKNWDRFM